MLSFRYWKLDLKGIITLRAYMNILNQVTKKIAVLALLTMMPFLHQAHAAKENNWAITQKSKIIKYLLTTVIWPTESIKSNTLNVCLVGKFDDIKPINALNGTQINTFNIKVRKSSLEQSKSNCQLIYISNSEKEKMKEIIQDLSQKPILLISDIANFADQGGAMNFVETNESVAITVNVETIKNSKLSFDMKNFSNITVIPQDSDLAE